MDDIIISFNDVVRDSEITMIGYRSQNSGTGMRVTDVLFNGRPVANDVQDFLIGVVGFDRIEQQVLEFTEKANSNG